MTRSSAAVQLLPSKVAPEDDLDPDDDVEEEEEEEEELLDCGCVDDHNQCDQVGHDFSSTCVDCCDIAHCSACGGDTSEDTCTTNEYSDYCSDCCGCLKCEGCDYGKCITGDNGCTSCCQCNDCGCSCGPSGMGEEFFEAPWVGRGIDILVNDLRPHWTELWHPGHDEIDVVASMAAFYLLDGIHHMVFNGAHGIDRDPTCQLIAHQAGQMRQALVEQLDASFQDYIDLAVGGELRHHKACMPHLRRADRCDAWSDWFYVRQAAGPQALLDAAKLFRDFNSSGYGGEPWARAAELLHHRVTGRFDPATFVDRTFAAQHNGGSLLNKLSWRMSNPPRWNIGVIAGTQGLGAAHAANPTGFGPLLAAAPDEVVTLFSEWWRAANRWRRDHALAVAVKPTWRTDGHNRDGCWYWPDFESLAIDLSRHSRWGWKVTGEEPAIGDPCLVAPNDRVPRRLVLRDTRDLDGHPQELYIDPHLDPTIIVGCLYRGVWNGLGCYLSSIEGYDKMVLDITRARHKAANKPKSKPVDPSMTYTIPLHTGAGTGGAKYVAGGGGGASLTYKMPILSVPSVTQMADGEISPFEPSYMVIEETKTFKFDAAWHQDTYNKIVQGFKADLGAAEEEPKLNDAWAQQVKAKYLQDHGPSDPLHQTIAAHMKEEGPF